MEFHEAWSRAVQAQSAVTEAEAAVLWAEAKRAPGSVVEIGSWHGRMAVVLAHAVHGDGHLHTVDPFDNTVGIGGTTFNPSNRDSLLQNMRNHAPGGSWTCHHRHSADLAASWDLGEVSFLWVDGDHSEAGTAADWASWVPLLAPDARIALHDRHFPGPAMVLSHALSVGWKISAEVGSLVVLSR